MTEVEKWMLKHYTQDLDSMKCNYCQEIFSDCNRLQNFKYHLHNMHNVLELDEHPECDKIQKNYKISSLMATCNHCKKTINLAIHGVHVLTMHLKIFHSDNSKIKISRARDKYDIKGNKATCKGCKKTLKVKVTSAHAGICLRQHLHYCPHFKTDFPLKKNMIMKQIEEKKRSHVWDKYDVMGSNATCKGCKKTLKVKVTSAHAGICLRQHLHYCPHFKTDFPLKKNMIMKQIEEKKRSHVWDKYDVMGSNATCKGCKKIVKIPRICKAAKLLRHLHYCPHFKTDFPVKKNKITKQIEEKKRSHVWDKYDVMGSNATCKGCKKIVKIPRICKAAKLLQHLHFCPHFKIDFPRKKEITFKIKRKKSHIWDKYDITDNNNATCKGCKKTLKVKVTSAHAGICLRQHLHYCPYFKTDFLVKKNKITKQIEEKKRSHVWDKYDVMGSNATCKGCKKIIKIPKISKASTLLEHLHYCPHFKIDFPRKKEITFKIERKKSHIWDKYDITDNNNATCKGCKKTLKVKVTSTNARICLRQHLRYCPHFKIDFPREEEITKRIRRRTSDIWDKYDITDNNVICKGCKKTLEIKITNMYAAKFLRKHLHHCPHFKIDFPLKKEITFKITRKRSHIWNKYDITDNNSATCKGCKKTLKTKVTSINAVSSLHGHLNYCPHFKTDFPRKKQIRNQIGKKKTSRVWDRYDVMGSYATCKGCKKTIKIDRACAVSTLLAHLRCCPHFKIDFPLKKEITKKSHVWSKYDVTDNNNATCKGCKKTLKIKITSPHAGIHLRSHLLHCPNDFLDKKVKEIIHMIRVQCNGQQCEVKDVKRKKKQ